MIVPVFTLPRMTPDFSFLMHGLFSSLVLIYRFKSLSLSNIFKTRCWALQVCNLTSGCGYGLAVTLLFYVQFCLYASILYCISSFRELIYAVGHYSFHLPIQKDPGGKNALKSTFPAPTPAFLMIRSFNYAAEHPNLKRRVRLLNFLPRSEISSSQEVWNCCQPYLCWN